MYLGPTGDFIFGEHGRCHLRNANIVIDLLCQ